MIKKAIVLVAGYGTRFLPATKNMPKEMLPVVDKPVIQYLVEEAVAAGIEEIIFVTGRGKRSIEDHFDKSFELEHNLVEKNKKVMLEDVRKISHLAKFAYVRQPEPKGDGDALLRARHLIGDEPVAVLFGDDIIDSEIPALKQLMKVYEKYQDPVICLEKVPRENVSSYGIIDGVEVSDRVYEIKNFVEKPSVEEAPSNLAVVGKYIITPEVFKAIEQGGFSKDGEMRLADGFIKLLEQKPVYGCVFEGKRFDCGSKIGFLKATVEFGLKHEQTKDEFNKFLLDKLANSKKIS
ncbi:MAG: UTP--glucose-1-phosphate uridylyltransferase GalU [Candidatus Moranbacteria bacterium]|nr:UTP--glucose-1-phosphate uridylyltransferase GalU [Candidatus Moranbacteria bacterium]